MVRNMNKSKLQRDAENMQEITERLVNRDEIWQDRYIYWIAVAVLHLLEEVIKLKRNSKL